MGDVKLPADFAIDALALETDKRRKALGRPYSYGQLIADATEAEREEIAEDYRKQFAKAGKQGHRPKIGNALMPQQGLCDVEDSVCQKLTTLSDIERAGE